MYRGNMTSTDRSRVEHNINARKYHVNSSGNRAAYTRRRGDGILTIERKIIISHQLGLETLGKTNVNGILKKLSKTESNRCTVIWTQKQIRKNVSLV